MERLDDGTETGTMPTAGSILKRFSHLRSRTGLGRGDEFGDTEAVERPQPCVEIHADYRIYAESAARTIR
jgi:hypothetical protein